MAPPSVERPSRVSFLEGVEVSYLAAAADAAADDATDVPGMIDTWVYCQLGF